MALTKEDFVKEIEKMSVSELNELVEGIKERFNVTGVVAVAAAGAGEGAGGGEVEKSAFDVVLSGVGPNKIAVIKEIRAILNIGLIDAKKLAETENAKIKEGASKADAEELKSKLEGAGASVELK